MTRSVSTELELDAGTYSVLMKITARRYQSRLTVDDVIRMNCKGRQEKLLQIGLSYDLGHAKGIITETEEERQAKAEQEAKAEATAKAKAREEAKQRKYQDWLREKKRVERNRREKRRAEEHRKKKAAQKEEESHKRGKDTKITKEAEKQDGAKEKSEMAERIGSHVGPITNDLQSSESRPDITDSEATPVVDPATSDADGVVVTPPLTEKEHDGTPSSAIAVDTKENEDSLPAPTGAGADDNPKMVAIQANLESIQARPDNDLTTQEKIDKFNADPVLKSPVPAVQVNGKDIPSSEAKPEPPASPGFLGPPADVEDEETVITYASSIDTDLDERYFENPEEAEEGYEEPEDACEEDEEFENYSNDPWNAVCVVGLRLYTREGVVSVDVTRPKVGGEEEESPLDLDDPSKGMSDEPLSPTTKEPPSSMVEKLEDVVKAAEAPADKSSS